MAQTTNYSLNLPEYNETADIMELNENFKTIDTQLKRLDTEKAGAQKLESFVQGLDLDNKLALKADKTTMTTELSKKMDVVNPKMDGIVEQQINGVTNKRYNNILYIDAFGEPACRYIKINTKIIYNRNTMNTIDLDFMRLGTGITQPAKISIAGYNYANGFGSYYSANCNSGTFRPIISIEVSGTGMLVIWIDLRSSITDIGSVVVSLTDHFKVPFRQDEIEGWSYEKTNTLTTNASRTELQYHDLFQSVVDGKNAIATAINDLAGNSVANSSMTHADLSVIMRNNIETFDSSILSKLLMKNGDWYYNQPHLSKVNLGFISVPYEGVPRRTVIFNATLTDGVYYSRGLYSYSYGTVLAKTISVEKVGGSGSILFGAGTNSSTPGIPTVVVYCKGTCNIKATCYLEDSNGSRSFEFTLNKVRVV